MLVVDAYNVLHTQGILPPHLAGPEVHELIEMIGASRYKRHRAIVVCDGVPGADGQGPGRWVGASGVAASGVGANEAVARKPREERRDGGGAVVDVVFAGPGREADEAIETILQSHSAARRMLVVSTDRRVRRAAAKAGAASITSAEFLRDIAADLERHKVGRGGAGLSQRPSFATDLPLSRLEVAYWLAHMGMEGDAAATREAMPRSVERKRPHGGPEHGKKPEEKKPEEKRVDGKIEAGKGEAGKGRVAAGAMGVRGGGKRGGEDGGGGRVGEESKAEGANTHAGVPRDGTPSWMHEAARAWAGRLNLEELDTGKWLDSPLAPEPTKNEPTKNEPTKSGPLARGRTSKGARRKA